MTRSGPDAAGLTSKRLLARGIQSATVIKWLRATFRGGPTFSLLFLSIAMICAVFAPVIVSYDPLKGSLRDAFLPPGISSHPLGTDNQGRDVLSRIIYGTRISVTIGMLAVFVAGAVGTAVALISGVFRGWADRVLMRITDGFLSLPFLMVAVTIISILGPSMLNVILVIGLFRWMGYARVLRGEVLRLTEMDFVRLARVAGLSRGRIIVRHIFPNILNTLLVLGTLEVGVAVIAEAGLSFLGLGIPKPLPSWGTMLAESQQYLWTAWWLPLIPGIAISLLVMSFNLTGDWLRDRFDPTRRQL